jgi:hypothetical protein
MRGIERARGVGIALGAVALFAVAGAVGVGVAAASPASTDSSPTDSAPAARASLRIGSLTVNITAPLGVAATLVVDDSDDSSGGPSASVTSSARPSASPAFHTPTATARPKLPGSRPRTTPASEGGGPAALGRHSEKHSRMRTSPHESKTTHRHASGGLVLTSRLPSSASAVLLVLVLVALVLGVAALVKLSGRRGGHQA